jgi:transposase-like protein
MPVPGDLENRLLRQAVQENLVSFPSQVPVFGKQSRPDLQQRIVLLYLVGGWTMDDIARRYGLGRQRVGQILTAWRIRAVKDGYIQAIDPAHPQFERVRLEQSSQFAAMPERASLFVARAPQTGPAVPASKAYEEPPPAIPNETGLKASALAEQLDAIVAIVNNQLLLCSKPFNGNSASCEPLLACAKTLCSRLEAQISAARSSDDLCTRAVISAAKELFQRFQNHVETIPPRTNQRIAISV